MPYKINVECDFRSFSDATYDFSKGELILTGGCKPRVVAVPSPKDWWHLRQHHSIRALAISGKDVSSYPKATRRRIANDRAFLSNAFSSR